MDPIRPTAAHVKQHTDRAALSILASKQAATVRLTGRQNLVAAVELGRTLAQLRPLYSHGEWTPYLSTIHVPSRRALEYISLSVFTDDEIMEMSGISEALELIASSKSADPPISDDRYEEDESEVIGPNEDPPEPKKPSPGKIRCERCIRLNMLDPCSECSRLRVAANAAAKFTKPAPGQREPGDDTDEIEQEKKAEQARRAAARNAPKNGAVVYNKGLFDKDFGPAVRAIDKVFTEAGLMKTPRYEGVRRILNEAYEEVLTVLKELGTKTNTER